MLFVYIKSGQETFGSYQCPFCFYWHITSEYDNRSKQCKHEFKNYTEHKNALNRKLNKERTKVLKGSLNQNQMNEVFKTFKPTVHKSGPRFWFHDIITK